LRHALRLLADHQDATGNQAIAKLVKAQQALDRAGHETGTVDIVKAIRGDLVATERLRALKGSA